MFSWREVHLNRTEASAFTIRSAPISRAISPAQTLRLSHMLAAIDGQRSTSDEAGGICRQKYHGTRNVVWFT